MKPSERIKEILTSDIEKDGNIITYQAFMASLNESDIGIGYILKATLAYLDEEWEKNQK